MSAVQTFLDDISVFLEKQEQHTVNGLGLLALGSANPVQIRKQPHIDWESHPALIGLEEAELFNRLTITAHQ